MIQVRKARQRGRAHYDWLDTQYSFSFADYFDPAHMGFRALRVMNEDRIDAGRGFPTHPHRDMEILTYVLSGSLEHRDSLGNGSVIRAGDLQRMTAGTGIQHSEYNPSRTDPVHLYQIWLLPRERGLKPGYEELPAAERPQAGWQLVAAGDGRNGALTIHQDADVHLGRLAAGETHVHALAPGRHAWLQVVRGQVRSHGSVLDAGDGLAVSDDNGVDVAALSDAEVLLFDLA